METGEELREPGGKGERNQGAYGDGRWLTAGYPGAVTWRRVLRGGPPPLELTLGVATRSGSAMPAQLWAVLSLLLWRPLLFLIPASNKEIPGSNVGPLLCSLLFLSSAL